MYEQWLAMGIDCDGHIEISNTSSRTVYVTFSNNEIEIVDVYEKRVNDLGCRTSRGITKGDILYPDSKQYVVRISGTHRYPGTEDKLRFLKAILPYLVRKRRKAEEAIKSLEVQLAKKPKEPKDKLENIMKPNLIYSTTELAELQEITRVRTFNRLKSLNKRGIVTKMGRQGERMYWKLTSKDEPDTNPEERWHKRR